MTLVPAAWAALAALTLITLLGYLMARKVREQAKYYREHSCKASSAKTSVKQRESALPDYAAHSDPIDMEGHSRNGSRKSSGEQKIPNWVVPTASVSIFLCTVFGILALTWSGLATIGLAFGLMILALCLIATERAVNET